MRTPTTRAARNARRLSRGVSLVETLFAVFLTGLVLTMVAQIFVPAMRSGKLVTSKATLQQQARTAMDYIVQDIRGAAGITASYGGYTSGPNTLILRLPSYNASYQQIQGTNDYVIYRRTGSAAPYSLVRTVAIASGSARPAPRVADTIIAKNVNSVDFTYMASQTITGNGITRTYPLLAISLSANLNNLLTQPTATVAGSVMVYSFTIASASVIFDSTPSLGAIIRLLYPADGSSASNESLIGSVSTNLRLMDTDPSIQPTTSAPVVELNGGASFRNH